MAPKKKDLSRCECGSDQFLVDVTDTLAVTLTSEGQVWEISKRYDGDYHNLNCARCGRPAPRQPETLASMGSKQKEAT